MQVPTILSGEQPRISVWLDNDKKQERTLKQFHCLVCGKVVFEYYNNVRMIIPGEPDFIKSPKVIQCHGTISVQKNGQFITTRCKSKYWVE